MPRRGGRRSKGPRHLSESNPHEPGTHESSFSHLYPQSTSTSEGQRARVQSPRLSFATDVAPLKAFRHVLTTLQRAHFSHAIMYDGPDLGLSDERPELVDMERVVDALATKAEEPLPMGGLKAVLVYDSDEKVRAKVKVKGGRATKVRVKVRGALSKTDWNMIRSRINRRFHVQV